MPRKQPPPIRTVAYVHVGDKLVNVDDLLPDQRQQLADWLVVTALNAAFAGKATFSIAQKNGDTKPEGVMDYGVQSKTDSAGQSR